jgi:hypothetical protein
MSTSISASALSRYCASFWRRRVPEAIRVWSVIDVKKVGIYRPSSHQRAQYVWEENQIQNVLKVRYDHHLRIWLAPAVANMNNSVFRVRRRNE